MTAAWEVTVAAEAERALRDLHPREQIRIAGVLDELARRGPSGDRDPAATWRVRIAGFDLLFAGRPDRSELVLVRIEGKVPRRGTAWVGLGMDLRSALRAARRSPVFTAVVVGTLALGVAGATAMLGTVYGVYRGALPFALADRLVRIRNLSLQPGQEPRRYNVSSRDAHVVREQARTFSGVAAQNGFSLSLVGQGDAERVVAVAVSPRWAEIMGLRPELGRVFTPEEDSLGSDAGVALISHALWQRRFGADPALGGLELRHSEGVLRVVGVMPPRFHYPYRADVWTPWTFDPLAWRVSSINLVARLQDGVGLRGAREDVDRVHAMVRADARGTTSATGMSLNLLRHDLIRDNARVLQALSATVLLLALLTCVSVTNLLVARFVTRRGEIGVRAALGASGTRLVRQLVLETGLMFLAGGAAGVGLAFALRRVMGVLVPGEFRNEVMVGDASLGAGVAASALGVCAALGLLVGIAAAIRASRTDLAALVKQGSRRASTRGDRRVFDVLVVAQLGLSLVLLVGAGALIEHFRRLTGADPGYDLAGVHTFRITLEEERYAGAEARVALVRALEQQIAAEPEVAAIGMTTVNPLCCGDWGAPIEVEGRPIPPGEAPPLVQHSYVSPHYFAAMRIALLRGDAFPASDQPGTALTVVVDQPMARWLWPGEDPIGKRIRVAREGETWRTVVGVTRETVREGELPAQWYLPYYQDPLGGSGNQLHLMVRARGPGVGEAVRRVVRRVDPGLALHGVTTMTALQDERVAPDKLGAVASGLFAGFGLLLAGFSLYGLLSYSIESRTQELGTRIALGAPRGRIVALVFREAVRRLAIGLAAGLALAMALNQVLRGLVAGVAWVPPLTFAGLLAILTGVAAAASAIPIRRAVRVDPARAMRNA